jgi:hypothetical protein
MGEAHDATNAPTSRRAATLDIGAGDQEAPANAIPNIIARLVETETWRNAATAVMGALLIGLGYWSFHGIRDAIAETRVASLGAAGHRRPRPDVGRRTSDDGEPAGERSRDRRAPRTATRHLPGPKPRPPAEPRWPSKRAGCWPLTARPAASRRR